MSSEKRNKLINKTPNKKHMHKSKKEQNEEPKENLVKKVEVHEALIEEAKNMPVSKKYLNPMLKIIKDKW